MKKLNRDVLLKVLGGGDGTGDGNDTDVREGGLATPQLFQA